MATIEEIGRRLKKQYPGTLDDVSDAEVGRRLRARYPEALNDVQGDDAPSRALLGESLNPTDPRFKGKTGPEAKQAALYTPPPTPDEIERAADAEASGFIEGVKLAASIPTATPSRVQLGGNNSAFAENPRRQPIVPGRAEIRMQQGQSAAATGVPVLASIGEAAARSADPNASTLRKTTGALMGAGDVALTAGAGPLARGLYGLGTGRSIQAGLRAASAGKDVRRAMAFERLKQLGIVTGAVGADVVAGEAANQLTQKGVEMVGEIVGADKEPTKDAAEFLGLLADYGVDLGFIGGAAKLINTPRPKLSLGEGKAKVQLGGEPASNAKDRGSSAPAPREPAPRPKPAAVGGNNADAGRNTDNAGSVRQATKSDVEPAAPAPAPEPAPVTQRIPEQDAPPAQPAGGDRPEPGSVRSAGLETKAKTRNLEVGTKLELVEAGDLVASSNDDLTPNSAYDADLQPRGQDPKETEARVGNILATFDPERLGDSLEAQSGAPIIARNDNQVESGNARVLAIRRAQRQNPEQATAYRAYLKANAERLGLDPQQVDSMAAPVLVRRRQTDMSRADRLKFVEEANEDIVNRTSARQTAKLDRERITSKMIEALDPEAGIDSAKNGEFVRAFLESVPPTERAQLLGEKGLSDAGRRRIEHALLSKAYGDTPTVRAIIEGDSAGHRNLQKAMAQAAPRFASLNDAVSRGDRFDLSISQELSDAAKQLESLREKDMTVDQFVNDQKRLPGTETEGERLADAVLLGVEAHKAAPKRLAGILRRYADLVDAAGSPKQTTMFGPAEPPSKADLFTSARRAEEIDFAESKLSPLAARLSKARAKAQLEGKPEPTAKQVLGESAAEYERWQKLKDELEQGQPIDDASRRFQERAEAETNPLFGYTKAAEPETKASNRETKQGSAETPPKAPDFTDPRAGAVRLRGSGQRAPRATQPVRFVRQPNPEGTLRVQQQRGERVARLFKPGDRPPGKVEQLILDTIESGKGLLDRIPERSVLKEQLVDRAAVLDEFVGKARPDLAKGDRDPYAARRLFEGAIGKAERTIDRELEPIIRPVRKIFNEVRELAVLERMDELFQVKGIDSNPGGLTPLEVNAWKERARARLQREGKLDKVEQALAGLRDYSQRQLAKLNAAGIIDDASYQRILATNQAYIPMQRIGYMTGEGNAAHLPARKFSVAGQDVLHTITGSQRELVDPLEAIIRNTYKAQTLIDRNEVARKLYDLRNLPEFQGLVQPLAKGQDAPQGFGEVKLYIDGNIERFAVPVRVADSMHGLGREQADLITRVARRGAGLLRAGATGLNLAFLPSNMVRDFQTLAVTQQMGVAETAVTWLRGLTEVLGKGKYFDEWASAGGSMSGYFEQLKGPQRTASNVLHSRIGKAARTIANPFEAIRLAGEIIEQTPRVGAFKRARVKLGESPQAAALRSRDATVDFAKVGEAVRLINQWVPFLNARLQGNLNIFRAFRDRPVGTMWAAGQMVLVPALATYYWNHANYPEVLDDIEGWEKEQNFVLVLGDEQDAQGRYTNVVKIPRGDVGKVLGGTVEAFLDYLHERDTTTWQQVGLRVLSDISPVSFEREGSPSLTRLLGDVLPPSLKAAAEVGTGQSFFTGRQIIPRSLEDATPAEQYRVDTPSAAVAIGQAMGVSPLLVHQAIRTQFGAVGDQAIRIGSGEASGVQRSVSRRFTGASGGAVEERNFETLEQIIQEREGTEAEAGRQARRLFDAMEKEPAGKRAAMLKAALRDAAASGGREAAALLLKSLRAESVYRSDAPFIRKLRSSTVKDRAQFLARELRGMTPAERGAYLRDMAAARILTPTVRDELKRILP